MKTDLTLKLEREIWLATVKQGVFGCYEVTIGQYGRERVDFMTMDTKGIFPVLRNQNQQERLPQLRRTDLLRPLQLLCHAPGSL